MNVRNLLFASSFSLFLTFSAQGQVYQKIENQYGPVLGYSTTSGVKILSIAGNKFKDLNRNGKLDRYEDWRLTAEERAKDLASKLSVDQIAGLMLYSRHQALPAPAFGFMGGTYQGKNYQEGLVSPWALTDQQREFLEKDGLRHVLLTAVKDPETAARWNNELQGFVEGLGWGIPANNSSDPRHNAVVSAEFNAGAGGQISMWPDGLAMAATFDPAIVKRFGQVAASEYRSLGITTALSPQIDLGTEPRWYRIGMTFGESPELTTAMARAYIDGFQTSSGKDEIALGWGYKSVNAMVKHWPSGGPEEGGRDGHWAIGKFAVYPGDNLKQHIMPFVNGAFQLAGKTSKAAAVMPYYTISFGQDKKNGENVGNGYSKYLLTDLLRGTYGYDGVICSDWLITGDEAPKPDGFAGKPWGVEQLSVAERHYKALMAGVDQFGGNNDKAPVLAAYELGVKEHGQKFMRQRFEASARRLLLNIFRVGLFENPYLDVKQSQATVGNPLYMKEGYEAQVKSVVLLKNSDQQLPIRGRKKVYVPKMYRAAMKDWWGNYTPARLEYPVNIDLLRKYADLTDNPSEADLAVVFVQSPISAEGGYSERDRKNGGNGYVPISLQYGTYTASDARAESIAAGDPIIDPSIKNRSYKNKMVTAANVMDLQTILDTKDMMKGKPILVSVTANKPMVFAEFEKEVSGIILNFGVSTQAVLDVMFGKYEPSGLLPVQMPANMATVEKQAEDVPFDMEVYVDQAGHAYDFGYGLNWSGVIKDKRVGEFVRK